MKKVLTLVLSLCLLISCALGMTACGGYGEPFSKDNFVKVLSSKYFRVDTPDGNIDISVMDNVYVNALGGVEYVKEVSDTETKYYAYASGEKIEIDALDYVDYATDLAVVVNFLKEKSGEFKEDEHRYYVYDGELDAEVKAKIEEYTDKTFNYHSIVLSWSPEHQYYSYVFFMNSPYEVIQLDENSWTYDFSSHNDFSLGFVDFTMSKYKETQILEDMSVNYTVKGGEGIDYMEFYFVEDSMRFITPNVEEGANMEAIFDYKDGVYRYYKRTKGGQWQVETLDETDYWNRYNTVTSSFTGGKIFENIHSLTKIGNKLERNYSLPAGNMGLYSTSYNNIVLNLDDNANIIGGSWILNFEASIAAVQSLSYKFNMTVGDAVIDVPNV